MSLNTFLRFDNVDEKKFTTVRGTRSGGAILMWASIFLIISLALKVAGITAFMGIPLVWIGFLAIAASVLLGFEPLLLLTGIGWLLPIYVLEWLTHGFLVG